MEVKRLNNEPSSVLTSDSFSPNIKVIVLPASNSQVIVRNDDAEFSRSNEIKHRPRKGFSYDGPGGSYGGF